MASIWLSPLSPEPPLQGHSPLGDGQRTGGGDAGASAAASVLLVCSSGGHLDQLARLEPWWHDHRRHWVTFALPDAMSRLRGESITWAHHPTTRNIPNLLRNLRLAWRVLRRERPDIVVSTGAGLAIPFFVLARLFGVRTVYLEVFDRITSCTVTGRICEPLSSLFLVQWPEQQRLYKRAVVLGSLYP